MPSLGVLGAIGGAAKGFESFLTEDLKNQRAMKMEELKTRNRRETNRIDAEMRNEMALGREEVRAKNNISLQELANQRPTANERDLQTLIEGGMDPTEAQNRIFPRQRGPQGQPPAIVAEAQWLMNNLGLDADAAYTRANSRAGMDPQQWQADIVGDLVGNGYSTDEALQISTDLRGKLFPQKPAQAPPAPQFNSMQEALEAAQRDYPGIDPAVLRQRIQERFPDLR